MLGEGRGRQAGGGEGLGEEATRGDEAATCNVVLQHWLFWLVRTNSHRIPHGYTADGSYRCRAGACLHAPWPSVDRGVGDSRAPIPWVHAAVYRSPCASPSPMLRAGTKQVSYYRIAVLLRWHVCNRPAGLVGSMASHAGIWCWWLLP